MNEYFYYFGFVYIIYLFVELYNCFKPKKNVSTIIIDHNVTMTDIETLREKMNPPNKSLNRVLSTAFGIILFAWAIKGYISDYPEKKLFLFDIIVVATNAIFWWTLGIITAIKVFSNMTKIQTTNVNDVPATKPTKWKIPVGEIFLTMELIFVSGILYHHFFVK